MRPLRLVPDRGLEDSAAGADPELEVALKKVLKVIYQDHPLSANQIMTLASELQRVGVHRLVDEHIQKFRQREP